MITKHGIFTVSHDEHGAISIFIHDYHFEGFAIQYQEAIVFCIEDIITKLQAHVVEMRQSNEQTTTNLDFSKYKITGEVARIEDK